MGNNCFIGYGSIILPGVKIADNCIVGAGSVVTKSVLKENSVVAGNPAKYICSLEDYLKRSESHLVNLDNMTREQIKNVVSDNPDLLKKR